MSTEDRINRVAAANELIGIIATCGREYFSSRDKTRIARLDLDEKGQLWFVDCHSFRRINTASGSEWSGFLWGGTLRDFIERLRMFVLEGTQIGHQYLTPESVRGQRNDWAYGEDTSKVLDAGLRLDIVNGKDL